MYYVGTIYIRSRENISVSDIYVVSEMPGENFSKNPQSLELEVFVTVLLYALCGNVEDTW